MKNRFSVMMILAVAVAIALFARPAFADTIFNDGTFNLSNYTINSYPTNGDTVNVTQTLTGGNPGAALEIMISAPATGSSTTYAFTYALNNTFVYYPSVQGAITSISFSNDRNVASITGASLGSEAATSMILQGGNYYQYEIPLPPVAGTWETASKTGLVASDYELVTNLSTDAVNAARHPNFAAGPLTFGEKTGYTDPPGLPATTAENLVDNLRYDIISAPTAPTSVPEPGALNLLGLTIVGAAVARQKRKS